LMRMVYYYLKSLILGATGGGAGMVVLGSLGII